MGQALGGCVERSRDQAPDAVHAAQECVDRGKLWSPSAFLAESGPESVAALQHELEGLKAENQLLFEQLAAAQGQNGPNTGRSHKQRPSVDRTTEQCETIDCDLGAGFSTGGSGIFPDVLNLMLKECWKFVSEWFETLMRESVQPRLQMNMPPGVSIHFGDACHLGTNPLVVRNPVATSYQQSMVAGDASGASAGGASVIHNVRIVGDLDYRGNCTIVAVLSPGRVELSRLTVTGAIVIELVRLLPRPPFFSGIRIFMPNAPEVNLKVGSHMLGLPINFSFVKDKLIQALSDIIAFHLVLPNRLAIPLVNDLDAFPLKHPRAQGVLRVEVLEARGLRHPGDLLRAVSGGAAGFTAHPYVAVTVGSTRWCTPPAQHGSQTPRWGGDVVAVHDFLVMDCMAQLLRIDVKDADYNLLGGQALKVTDHLGRVEVTISDLCAGHVGGICSRWLSLELDNEGNFHGDGLGEVYIRTQWRAFAHVRDLAESASKMRNQDSQWAFGDIDSPAWMLFVGVYGASMLPSAPDGTQHYVTVSVKESRQQRRTSQDIRSGASANTSTMARTKLAACVKPVIQGIEALSRLGLPAHVIAETLECDLNKVERYLQHHRERSGSQDTWADMLRKLPNASLSPVGFESAPSEKYGLVDVSWEEPLQLLIGSVDAIAEITVWQVALPKSKLKTFLRDSIGKVLGVADEGDKAVGTASYRLRDLLKRHQEELRFGKALELMLHSKDSPADAKSVAQIRLRLQLRPLESSSGRAASPKTRRNTMTASMISRRSSGSGQRQSVFHRQMAREAAMTSSFCSPASSEDED